MFAYHDQLFISAMHPYGSPFPGRKTAPNTGANATKFFALATKSLKLVANLATRISNHTLIPRDIAIVEDLLR